MLPVLSEISPMSNGASPPPMIDITRNDEASLVSSPSSLIPSAKIVGNMMDIKNGTAITVYTAAYPFVVNATVNSTILINAYKLNNFAGLI